MNSVEEAPVVRSSDHAHRRHRTRRSHGQTSRRHHSARPSKTTVGSRTRSIYFVLTGVWGFLLGGAALAVGLSLSGLTPRITMPLVAVFAALLATTVISSLVLKNSYTETRRRQKR